MGYTERYYQNPIGGPDPYEKFRVNETVEGQAKKDQPDEEPPKNKEGLAARLLKILQQAVDYFIERHADSSEEEAQARGNLILLKDFFETMKGEDRSQDVDFLNDLSKSWNQSLEDSPRLNEAAGVQFKHLVKKILHYPENQSHTLGYYLTEYAGQKWVPFPYMELMAKIHSEHEKNPPTSSLTEWVSLLSEVIRLLNEK